MEFGSIDNLVEEAVSNHRHRQTQTFNLIPSENTPSLLVRLLSILDPSGRYAEHRKMKAFGKKSKDVYFYRGTEFIAKVEELVKKFFMEYLGCSEVEVRPISGQMANTIVFRALIKYFNRYSKDEFERLGYVLSHNLGKGGHLSVQVMEGMSGGLGPFVKIDPETGKPAIINFPVMKENPYRIDVEKTKELMLQYKPQLIIFGKSMMIEREPIPEIADFNKEMEIGAITVKDGAHDLGQEQEQGAHLYMASTHKTFFGTQRGIIASNMSEGTEYRLLWEKIEQEAFPGSMSNHHLGTLLGLLGACYEWIEYGLPYRMQYLSNANAFAKALQDSKLTVEGAKSKSYTETHQVLINVGRARGYAKSAVLEENNIITNPQVLPYDASSSDASGLRLGTQEMTRFGMKEEDFGLLAEFMADIILRNINRSTEVAEYRKKFTSMQYCFPEERVKKMVGQLIGVLIGR